MRRRKPDGVPEPIGVEMRKEEVGIAQSPQSSCSNGELSCCHDAELCCTRDTPAFIVEGVAIKYSILCTLEIVANLAFHRCVVVDRFLLYQVRPKKKREFS